MSAIFKYSRQAKQQPSDVADGGIPIGKLVGPLLKSVKLDEQCRLGVIEEQWEAMVGKGISAHSRPGRLINKELTIFVDSSPWLSELKRYAQKELLQKIQKGMGRGIILTLRLQLDPGAAPDAKWERHGKNNPPPPKVDHQESAKGTTEPAAGS